MEEDQMSDGMEIYKAYLDAIRCAEALLTAHHIKQYTGRPSTFNAECAVKELGRVAQALGFTLTPIKAETKSERIERIDRAFAEHGL
jgi:hypothetical protein